MKREGELRVAEEQTQGATVEARISGEAFLTPKQVSTTFLYAAILVFATLGVYSLANSLIDVLIMYLIGVVGFFMRRYDFPVGPMILGVILGPLLEQEFRTALQISQGDLTIFLTRPISAVLLLPQMPENVVFAGSGSMVAFIASIRLISRSSTNQSRVSS